MLTKTTNYTSEIRIIGTRCVEEPPPTQTPESPFPEGPFPPAVNIAGPESGWEVVSSPDIPVCPEVRLVKFTNSRGECMAQWVPAQSGTPVSANCILVSPPFPATGC